jgi:hypothetical protein
MLWRGMLPALYRHAIYTGIRMSAYEEIRDRMLRDNKVEETIQFLLRLFRSNGTVALRVGQQCRLEQSRLHKITIPTIIVKIMSTTVIPTLMLT